MQCYCLGTNKDFIKNNYKEDWVDVGGKAGNKYCLKWMANNYQQ